MAKKYVRTPTVYQMEATECGAASLSMVLAYFGCHVPLEKMRIETGVSRDGCNAGNIMKAAKRLGLECHGYRKEPAGLRKLTPPCIIHWNFNHFVVLEGFRGDHAYINDPACGRRRLTLQELDDGFTGVVLTFAPTERLQKIRSSSGIGEFIAERLRGNSGALAKLVLAGVLLVFPGVLLPVVSQVFLDEVVCGGAYSWIWGIVGFVAGCVLLRAVLSVYRGVLLQRLRDKMVMITTYKFLSRLLRLPIGFFDQRYAGDLAGRVDDNIGVCSFLAGDLAETALNVLTAVFYLALMLVYSPLLTLIACIAAAVNLAIALAGAEYISKTVMKQQQDAGRLAGAVCAGLGVTSTLKASGAENEYTSRILGFSARTASTEQRLSRLQQIISAIPGSVSQVSSAAMILAGGILTINGGFTVGMLLAFITLYGSFCEPVEQLVGFVRKIQTVRADISRIQDISRYGTDPKFDNKAALRENSRLDGRVELRDVSFGYSRLEKPLLEGLSFSLPAGGSAAFVGASGCGKSTVSKLVSGLYLPWGGEILFDGKPISEIPPEIFNASVSTVSQNVTLFSGTVRDNITMWNDNILEKDIIAAAKDACIHDLITSLPGAYDYRLTEGATNLSGGQRQRLEIARALVTDPSVLIMDEATSALDPIVEKQIIDNIKRRGCTCVIVAHRLSAIRDCDQVIVLERGRVIQRGSHEELAAQEGQYRRFIANG